MTQHTDGQLRGLRWALFFGFVACFVLMAVVAWKASEDPFLPTVSVAFVALLVAVRPCALGMPPSIGQIV